MINSNICTDCICLAMCISKANGKLIGDCRYIDNAINNICESLINRDSALILFRSLNRRMLIQRVGLQLVIKDTAYFNSEECL